MYFVYILKSTKHDRFYIGHTQDIVKRLNVHNSGRVRSTKGYLPWTIIYKEKYQTKSEAQKREYGIKSYKGGYKFKELVKERC